MTTKAQTWTPEFIGWCDAADDVARIKRATCPETRDAINHLDAWRALYALEHESNPKRVAGYSRGLLASVGAL